MTLSFDLALEDQKSFILQCMFDLYAHDTDGETITELKFNTTWNYLQKNPNNGEILVFKNNSDLIGYAILIFQWSNEFGGIVILIDELFIIPPYRSKGIGASFFKQLITKNKMDFKGMQLEVANYNTKAKQFYLNNNFIKANRVFLKYINTKPT